MLYQKRIIVYLFAMIGKRAATIHNFLSDELELQRLYVSGYPAAERYVLKNNGTSDHAKDIFQEAFIATWRNIKLGKFIPEHENAFAAYLLRVVRNKWIDHLRSAQHKKSVALHEMIIDQKEEELPLPDQDEKLDRIRERFEQLGDTCRQLLTRFYYKKESLKTISEWFGWTEATARNNKYRCIERLRASLQIK